MSLECRIKSSNGALVYKLPQHVYHQRAVCVSLPEIVKVKVFLLCVGSFDKSYTKETMNGISESYFRWYEQIHKMMGNNLQQAVLSF